MTVIVTSGVADRFRGFLSSCMLEIAPGVYTASRMRPTVRDRVWAVLDDWWRSTMEGSVVMTWADPQQPGGQAVRSLGVPQKEIVKFYHVHLARLPPRPS